MKKLIILLILTACFCTTLKAQDKHLPAKKDTIDLAPIAHIQQYSIALYNRIHQMDIKAKTRDTLDYYLQSIHNWSNRQGYLIDSLKNNPDKYPAKKAGSK